MTTEYTNNFRFNLPDFRMGPWHDLVNTNTVRIDQLLMSIYQGVDTSPWQNNYNYKAGVTAVDNADNSFWVCVVDHTSAPAPTTFAEDRLAHPTYWNRVVVGIAPRGPWLNDTHYLVNDMVSDASQGVIAICITEHISSPDPATIRDDAANWTFIVDMTGTDALDASLVAYDDSTGYTGAGDVDVALDWLASVSHTNEAAIASIGPVVVEHEARLDTAESEIDVAQAQLADHDTRISSNTATIGSHTTQIAAITASDTAQNARLTSIEGAGYIGEAPNDGNKYARQSHAWIPIDTAAVLVSDTAPASAPDNALWWESDTGQLYIRYNDGDTTQWVVAVPQLDAGSFLSSDPNANQVVRTDAAQATLTTTQKRQAQQNIFLAPTITRLLSGSGTYNTPTGCTWLRVRMVASGAGGCGSGTAAVAGTAGNNTTFGPHTANGGGAGSASSGGIGGSGTIGAGGVGYVHPGGGGEGGNAQITTNDIRSGGMGGSSMMGGGAYGMYYGNPGAAAAVNSGGGGGGGGSNNAAIQSGPGGGGGGGLDIIIAAPAASYAYSVGASAAGGAAGTGGLAGGASGSGQILVEEHYGS